MSETPAGEHSADYDVFGEQCPDNGRCPNCTRYDVNCEDGCPTCDDWFASPEGSES